MHSGLNVSGTVHSIVYFDLYSSLKAQSLQETLYTSARARGATQKALLLCVLVKSAA